jgi:hypothetical protein
MSSFWGYPGADLFAVVVIGGVSALSLLSAYLFVKHYGR